MSALIAVRQGRRADLRRRHAVALRPRLSAGARRARSGLPMSSPSPAHRPCSLRSPSPVCPPIASASSASCPPSSRRATNVLAARAAPRNAGVLRIPAPSRRHALRPGRGSSATPARPPWRSNSPSASSASSAARWPNLPRPSADAETKGEAVIVVAGAEERGDRRLPNGRPALAELLKTQPLRAAVDEITARYGLKRKEVYDAALALKARRVSRASPPSSSAAAAKRWRPGSCASRATASSPPASRPRSARSTSSPAASASPSSSRSRPRSAGTRWPTR